ncbi:hypothetical protein V6N13_054232 [Hibiscus sabdariffa]|uniref:Uncharacterized protein n=2 Tax=Hibiscus sabdariffa TaxID=183260 RepID=A0ABR2E029_9ROSI
MPFSGEKLLAAQDFSHQTVNIDSTLNFYATRELEDLEVGDRLSGAVGEASLWGLGEATHVGSVPVTIRRLAWEVSVDMANSVQVLTDLQ